MPPAVTPCGEQETLDPTSLGKPRSSGRVCFNGYRIRVTVPERVGAFDTHGATLVFQTTVDDYGEVWVNGKLPRHDGEPGGGGTVVAGCNAPNRLLVARNVQPGQLYDLAVFGINGPISAAPGHYIFLRRPTKLDFYPG